MLLYLQKTTQSKIKAMKSKSSFENRLLGLQDNMFNFALTLTADREDAKDLLHLPDLLLKLMRS